MRAKAPIKAHPTRVRPRPARTGRRRDAEASAKPLPAPPAAAGEHPFVEYGRKILSLEAEAIAQIRPRLDEEFVRAVDILLACEGHVVVTGIGKPGFIAQKLSAILASTGVPSLYLHPADAAHGDLGRVTRDDVLLALSNSGSTEEIVRLLPPLRRIGARVIAVTGNRDSPLGRSADVVVDFGRLSEACPMGLVPTASSAALHAVCDALAMTVLNNRRFTTEDYALYHPGGSLGREVMKVAEVMRRGEANPVVMDSEPLHRVVAVMTNTTGRPGATNVVDRRGRLVGIFTDGDLRRLVEKGHHDFLAAVRTVMGQKPHTCSPDDRVHDAAARMRAERVDQLPVIDPQGRAVGLLDVQDLLAARFL